MRYVALDADRRAAGFYDDEIHHAAIPPDAAPLPDALYLRWIALDTSRWRLSADGAALEPADQPAGSTPVPVEVSLKQLLFALRDQGWITYDEALAAACTGALPGTLAVTLDAAVTSGAMPQSAADDAALTWAAMYTAERSSGLWGLLIGAGVATPEQVDDLFRTAAAIA